MSTALKDWKTTRGPFHIWNQIPDEIREHVVEVAKEELEKTPRELAWYITDTERYYISESSVYRILKEYDLITSPAYVVISAADRFNNPTRAVHEFWQTDFTYLKVTGWGWYYTCQRYLTISHATSSPGASARQ